MAAAYDNDLEFVFVQHVDTITYKQKGAYCIALLYSATRAERFPSAYALRLRFSPAQTLFFAYDYNESGLDLQYIWTPLKTKISRKAHPAE